jgi:hypothetical protein
MSDLQTLTPEDVKRIRQALEESRADDKAVAIDRRTGACLGAASLDDPPDEERVNLISKFDTHYAAARRPGREETP